MRSIPVRYFRKITRTGLNSSLPYYANLLPSGFYTGYSSKGYFNHACITHINNPVLPDPIVTEPVDPFEPEFPDDPGGDDDVLDNNVE